ncbi:SDR family oxidoreductase [Saccharolobus islandicus]|uniref:Short-chain dehydrogenase/reductase SDR n=2 Tax=Saccharolobus islandicus TaxID=43080 RepID=C3MTV8_SACI4|nr:SDR family oxidoreductase [Sulfolobus islandicus]ACP36992.1 short-chain dehydrogenase/reductase SDR [Sulfolobus islandicus M.14.25]ACP54129.1 short-chain dehydrogenase/reductase SDR [Sulfolobus islandicus M.16.27]
MVVSYNMRFKDKVILITGGTRGIGRAITEAFLREEGLPIVLYNSAENEAKKLREKGVFTIKCDVGNRDEVKKSKEVVEKEFGRVDVIVNNAGIMVLMPFEEFDDEKYNKMIKINLNGAIYTTYEFLPLLKLSKNGAIVNIASNAGIGTAAEGTTFYAITKAGIIILTRRLAFELGKYGIRVNAVAPGWVETDMTLSGKNQEDAEKLRELFRNKTVLKTTGKPEDIANIVLFLSSDEARYITGQVIVADGGRIDNLTHSL